VTGPDVLVQIHIPKCAGTSVAAWLRHAAETGLLNGFGAFYPEFVFDDDRLWQAGLSDPRLSAVSAHNIRRFPREVRGRHMRYFTILRRPRAHFLSMVRYVIQERIKYGVPPEIGNSSREIAELLLADPKNAYFRNNVQTNHLALYPWCDATGGRLIAERFPYWAIGDQAAYERERLDVAKDVLRSFMAAGTVERLHETLEVVRRRSAAHWLHLLPAADVPVVNVTQVPMDDISWLDEGAFAVRVAASLECDVELHRFGEQLLDEALANL